MTTKANTYPLALRPLLAAAAVLIVALLAKQLSDGMAWSPGDFVFAGGLVTGTGVLYELAARKAAGSTAYRIAAGIALAGAFMLVWANGAVGLIGDEGNRANVMYAGVLAIGFFGAILARLRPLGMSRTLLAMAAAQALIAVIAIAGDLGAPVSGPWELVMVNGFFVALFGGSSLLFRQAAEETHPAGAGATD